MVSCNVGLGVEAWVVISGSVRRVVSNEVWVGILENDESVVSEEGKVASVAVVSSIDEIEID